MLAPSRFFPRFVFLLVLALACSSQAATEPSSTYVFPDTLPPMLLPPPPAEGSNAWRQEVERVLEIQANIPASDRTAMRNEQYTQLNLMTGIIGNQFTRERFPKTFLLLDQVLTDTQIVTDADKRFWHTRRPYLADHRIKSLVDRIDKSPAYPSGHTSTMHVIAEVLGMLYPERLTALRARADAIARHRIEAGVHYPADIRGGETLAAMITGALMDNDYFQDALTLAREEIMQIK